MRWLCIAAVVTTISLLNACSKSDSPGKSTRELLVNTQWVIVSNISVDSAGKETNILSSAPEYEKDDYMLFNEDSTYEINDNLILRSDTATRLVDAGTWLLSPDQKTLQRESRVYPTTYHPSSIKEISETELYLETSFPTDKSLIKTRYRAQN